MSKNRIVFPGNPWPEGHGIKEFRWTAAIVDGDIWFHFHLETEDYYSERDIEHDESVEYPSDWAAPIVWGNFHSCTISSNNWHSGGFRVCSAADFSLDRLDGLRLHVDPLPCDLEEYDERAFHTYLLGHDTVVDHRITFLRITGTDHFDIEWEGKIALTYVGDYEPKHRFHAALFGIRAPTPTDGD